MECLFNPPGECSPLSKLNVYLNNKQPNVSKEWINEVIKTKQQIQSYEFLVDSNGITIVKETHIFNIYEDKEQESTIKYFIFKNNEFVENKDNILDLIYKTTGISLEKLFKDVSTSEVTTVAAEELEKKGFFLKYTLKNIGDLKNAVPKEEGIITKLDKILVTIETAGARKIIP